METCTGFELMAQKAPIFANMAQIAGLKPKGSYSIAEVSRASGVAPSTLFDHVALGMLEVKLPPGRERGRRVEPESFDKYWTVYWHAE